MTFSPQLTIGIPTLGSRPDRLTRAIASALGQSSPALVLISDQAADDTVEKVVAPFLANPLVRVTKSPATCLWENWTHATDTCTTPLFAWLQDDDIVSAHFARRVYHAFSAHPSAVVWLARLGISLADGMANWWQATGPMIPMDLLNGGLTEIHGRLLSAGSFFTSFALSPGVAFRLTDKARQAVHNCPKDSDLFVERSILSELGQLGPAVCDPAIVGMWAIHGENESRRQLALGGTDRQFEVMARHAASLLEQGDDWRPILDGWLHMVGKDQLLRWHADVPNVQGIPALDEARAMLAKIIGPWVPKAAPEVSRKKGR